MMLLIYFMRSLCVIFICMTFLLSCQGLRCWHCLNQNSNWECIRNGFLVNCASNQDHCQNELRFIANRRYYKITKGCKQGNGCVTQRRQNELRPHSYQCQKSAVADACWCCCSTDNCNSDIYCRDVKPTCLILLPPANGFVRCNRNDGSVGGICIYRCNRGFYLVGNAITTCTRTATGASWSPGPPSCKPVVCEEANPPVHGSLFCNNGISTGSRCRFICESGYKLIGAPLITCGHFGSWTSPPPKCIKVVCRFLPRRMPHLDAECTNGNKLGSICSFSCTAPYHIEGDTEITCRAVNGRLFGRWTGNVPQCARAPCPTLYESSDLVVTCSDDNSSGSTCKISCPSNMMLTSGGFTVSDQIVQVVCTAEGWSGDIPECRLKTCPVLRNFENGEIECSDGHNLNSSCEYICNSGYRLLGNGTTKCRSTGEFGTATWSDNAAPTCSNKLDELDVPRADACPNYSDIANGVLSCSPDTNGNGTHWLPQTVCQLRCTGEFYSPIGERSLISCSSKKWIGQVCCDKCLSTPKLDIITLLDSSNVDEEKWEVYKSFIHDFVMYIAKNFGFKLDIYVIPYSSTVDVKSRVKAPNIAFENFEEIYSYTQSLPYVGTGVSNTGLALRYVNDEILGELQPGSVPLVVIVTNRWPDDVSLAVIESQLMRDEGIHIRVVPITNYNSADPGSDLLVFRAITGGERNSVVNSNSEENFYEDATAGIEEYDTYCEDRISTC